MGDKAYGDFQTPAALAQQICRVARGVLADPGTVVEPTCGVGNILVAALEEFGPECRLLGVERNEEYCTATEAGLTKAGSRNHSVVQGDFFSIDWEQVLGSLQPGVLVVGNPPWVTNAELGGLEVANLPRKSNARGLRGLDALTGKSNFDISEWMCVRLLELLAGTDGGFALLVKVAVARKVLAYAWEREMALREVAIHMIDAKKHFGASVDACLFVGRTDAVGQPRCPVYQHIGDARPTATIGWQEQGLVADLDARTETARFVAVGNRQPIWRSGVKHDCAKVLELRRVRGTLTNGLGEEVDVERGFVFPLRKSSDVAKGRDDGERWVVLPQRRVGEQTAELEQRAPRLWAYLQRHGERLDRRKSSIYRARPRFSIFGVGEYTFAGWKVAISGLYKTLEFRVIGPDGEGRPVVFDDTVYFLPCADQVHARWVHRVSSCALARRFFASYIFWDAKRPITAGVLRRLDLRALSEHLGWVVPDGFGRVDISDDSG